ncbi:MAG: hypothetical protein JWQ91_3268, partial [Aeromicrobium sp.]|nr:hypothetical protein [Aeromicrobium sp.]
MRAQGRQSASEDRHGLESWKDNQPKVSDPSDIVEDVQSRAAKRDVGRYAALKNPPRTHSFGDCPAIVCGAG